MLISLLGSQLNRRDQSWLDHWSAEFTRLGFAVLINPDHQALLTADALVFLADGRVLAPELYTALGYFYHLKSSETRQPQRLLVALDESASLSPSLRACFDHVATTDKGLINTVKDYLYFINHHA